MARYDNGTLRYSATITKSQLTTLEKSETALIKHAKKLRIFVFS